MVSYGSLTSVHLVSQGVHEKMAGLPRGELQSKSPKNLCPKNLYPKICIELISFSILYV